MKKRLYRSSRDRMISGVCGGIGEYFNIDPTFIRILFVLLAFTTGIFFLIYLLMAIIVPVEGQIANEPRQTVAEDIVDLRKEVEEISKDIGDRASQTPHPEARRAKTSWGNYLAGAILIVVGVIFLVANLSGLLWWSRLLPVALILIGLLVIWDRLRR